MKLSDIMRVKMGLEPTEPIKHEPLNDETRRYFEKLKQVKEFTPKDYLTLLKDFQQVYEAQNGRMYQSEQETNLNDIIRYFANDIAFIANGKKRSFKKGLMLYGNYGTGKTTIIRALRECLDINTRYGFNSCTKIVGLFNDEGSDVIRRFANYKDFYFDDFGSEPEGSHYGKVNVMEKILEERYLSFQKKGIKTHISTNLSFEQIEQRYGQRIGSRLYEMFNVIVFNGQDYRKTL